MNRVGEDAQGGPPSPDEADDEPGNWYEEWLAEIAGEPVPLGRPILCWMVLVAVTIGLVYLGGDHDDDHLKAAGAAVSGPYWMFAIPAWAARRGRRRGTRR